MSSTARPIAFSITHGGPFHRLTCRLGLVRLDPYDPYRKSLAILAVTWMPVQLFAVLEGAPTGWKQLAWDSLAFNARCLVAVPLLFLAEGLLEWRCRIAIAGFDGDAFGRDSTEHVRRLARATEGLRDSPLAEYLLAGLIVVSRVIIWRVAGPEGLIPDDAGVDVSTVSDFWRAFVSLPVFNFLLLRWLWRWLLWTHLLWRLSRLPLQLIATHPDRAGGIRRLAEPSYALALMLTGVCSVFAAGWCNELLYEGAALASFAVRAVLALVVGELMALAPLGPFVRVLALTRLDGLSEYDRFALVYTRLFQQRWIEEGRREDLLGTPDISGLTDLISSVQTIDTMRITPMSREHIIAVALGVLLPMTSLPLVGSGMPLQDMVRRMIEVLLLGG